MDEPVHRLVGLAPLASPARRRLSERREVRERRVAPGQGAEVAVVQEPVGGGGPVDERVRPPIARLVEVEEDGADGHDADLLGHEHRPAGIGAVHREPARRALEPDRGARGQLPDPPRPDPARGHVGRQRDDAGARGGRGHAVRAHGLGAEGHGHPLPGIEPERVRLHHAHVDLDHGGRRAGAWPPPRPGTPAASPGAGAERPRKRGSTSAARASSCPASSARSQMGFSRK